MPAPVPWLFAFRRLATGQGVLLLVRCPEVGDGGGGRSPSAPSLTQGYSSILGNAHAARDLRSIIGSPEFVIKALSSEIGFGRRGHAWRSGSSGRVPPRPVGCRNLQVSRHRPSLPPRKL